MKNKAWAAARFCLRFVFGGGAYGTLEVAYRGYTHGSMLLLGGLCFCALYRLAGTKAGLFIQSLLGGALITAAEFLTGCVVNLWLGLNVWDYSDQSWHLMGQVCPGFFFLWCGLSAAVIPACRYARSRGWARQAPIRGWRTAAGREA